MKVWLYLPLPVVVILIFTEYKSRRMKAHTF